MNCQRWIDVVEILTFAQNFAWLKKHQNWIGRKTCCSKHTIVIAHYIYLLINQKLLKHYNMLVLLNVFLGSQTSTGERGAVLYVSLLLQIILIYYFTKKCSNTITCCSL